MMSSRQNHRRGIAEIALYHSKAIILLVLGLCVCGVAALINMASSIYPDVAFPRISVIVQQHEEAVERILIGVTRPLEEALNLVPGLSRIRSRSIRGACEISLDFVPSTDMHEALSQARARVAGLLPAFGPGVSVSVEQQTPSIFPVISFNVGIDPDKPHGIIRDSSDVKIWVEKDLKPRLSRLPDVFLVTVQGSGTRQLTVEPDPKKLAAANLSLSNLVDTIKDSNEIAAVGFLESDYKRYQLIASLDLQEAEEVADLPVKVNGGEVLRLRDVASVKIGVADRTTIVTGNGADSVVVSIFMRYGGILTDLSHNVTQTLNDLKPDLPQGVSITPVYNQGDLVQETISGIYEAIGVGILLSIVVLWIFLGSLQFTLIAGISIPISVLVTFAILRTLGQSLNLMSLGGIAVAIGLIIDDAIVVVENVARRLLLTENRQQAVIEGTREIVGAVTGSSLTTVVVFIPLGLLEGVVGQFFRAMAIALAVGILVSMVISLTLTPIMSVSRFGPSKGNGTHRVWMDLISAFYEKCIRQALLHRWLSGAALLLVLAVGSLVLFHQSTGFLPSMDEGGFVLDYLMPVGTSLGETDKTCRKIESLLRDCPEVQSFSRRTGSELGFFATEQNTGDFLVSLKPRWERKKSTIALIGEIRNRIAHEIPQVSVSFVQIMQDTIDDLAGNPSPIEVKIFGNDNMSIQDVADDIQAIMQKIPGLVDFSRGSTYGNPEMIYHLDPAAVMRAGLTVTEVERQIQTGLMGQEAAQISRDNSFLPVVVRYPDSIRHDPDWLVNLPISDGMGRSIPVSVLGNLTRQNAVNELSRENQQPVVSVKANISGRDLGRVAEELREKFRSFPLPHGIRLDLDGLAENQARAFRNLLMVLAIACVLVFLLLLIQFRSYSLSLVIFLSIPFALLGGLEGLQLCGTELNISAFMGLIMLTGLVVKNGIILIDYTMRIQEHDQLTLTEALARSGRVRLRPILMTSLTAIMALLPLALDLGSGADIQRPLAIVVIGGLSVSTLFTPIVIPVFTGVLFRLAFRPIEGRMGP
jgi:CzcA family heavy metal efflux pump